MSINKYHKHILPPAGGWTKVMDFFKNTHVSRMNQYQDRMMLLLIDFDQDEKRLDYIKNEIPNDLKERVFILDTLSEPEELKKNIANLTSLAIPRLDCTR